MFRQLSNQYHRLAHPHIKNRWRYQKFEGNDKTSFYDKISDFVNCVEQSNEIFGSKLEWPFTKIAVEENFIVGITSSKARERTSGEISLNKGLGIYWNCMAPRLTHMEVGFRLNGLDMKKYTGFLEHVEFGKLKKLQLKIIDTPSTFGLDHSAGNVEGIQKFLEKIPSLEDFDISASNTTVPICVVKCLGNLNTSKLTALRVSLADLYNIWNEIRGINPDIKLELIEIRSQQGSHLRCPDLAPFFLSQSSYLKKIILEPKEGMAMLTGIKFPKLTNLVACLDNLVCKNYSFAEQFPKLKHLDYREMQFFTKDFVFGTMHSVLELQVSKTCCLDVHKFLKQFVPTCFPSLKWLQYPAEVDNCMDVVNKLAGLKELTLTHDWGWVESRETFLAGIDMEKVDRIKDCSESDSTGNVIKQNKRTIVVFK